MINDLSNHTTKVLIVDDDEDDFFITSDLIRQIPDNHFKIDWCYNYNQALESIKSRGYDIYFVDYRLGIKTGLDLLKDSKDASVILLKGPIHLKRSNRMNANTVTYSNIRKMQFLL